jgi:hypothetical protein
MSRSRLLSDYFEEITLVLLIHLPCTLPYPYPTLLPYYHQQPSISECLPHSRPSTEERQHLQQMLLVLGIVLQHADVRHQVRSMELRRRSANRRQLLMPSGCKCNFRSCLLRCAIRPSHGRQASHPATPWLSTSTTGAYQRLLHTKAKIAAPMCSSSSCVLQKAANGHTAKQPPASKHRVASSDHNARWCSETQ